MHSALSLPLTIDQRGLGSLNIYGRERDAFTSEAVAFGQQLSAFAAVLIANAMILDDARRLADQLQEALTGRAIVDQAIGIIRSRSGASSAEALQNLKVISGSQHTKLTDVAHSVVDQAVARARTRRSGRT